jgi:hypothetical protein
VASSRMPAVLDASLVGTYPALTYAGGGYFWDEVLEYRVWCHAAEGDHFTAFAIYEDALAFSIQTDGAEGPIALILQKEYIDEPRPGHFVHMRKPRVTEWPIMFLSRPRRTPRTIPDFLRRGGER